MAGTIRKSRVKQVPLSKMKDDLSHLLREAAKQDIVITRHGRPAGVLIGFASENDWFEPVGWVEPCETHHTRRRQQDDGFRFTQPILRATLTTLARPSDGL